VSESDADRHGSLRTRCRTRREHFPGVRHPFLWIWNTGRQSWGYPENVRKRALIGWWSLLWLGPTLVVFGGRIDLGVRTGHRSLGSGTFTTPTQQQREGNQHRKSSRHDLVPRNVVWTHSRRPHAPRTTDASVNTRYLPVPAERGAGSRIRFPDPGETSHLNPLVQRGEQASVAYLIRDGERDGR
jgi:hypothetical protein